MGARELVESALISAGSYERAGNWSCPAHEDREPSLHLVSDRRGVAMTCHRGCSTTDITHALGLEVKDLFDEPLERREVARHRYLDETGEVLFAKIRYEPKDFRIEHPNGGGEWVKGLGDIRRVIYNLPAVLEAVKSGKTVWITEGEKDADRLIELGEVATCNFEGAGTGKSKWKPEYSAWLSGASCVTIVADRDDPGVAHAQAIAASLKSRVGQVKVVQSKTTGHGDDVSDHILAGYSLDQLITLRPENQLADRYIPIDWRTAWKEEAAQVRWLVEPVLEEGTLCALYGRPGDGKSLVTLWLCLQIVRSGGTVVMCDDENTRTDLVGRLKAFGATPDELDNLVVLNFASLPPLDTPEGGMHLAALADKYAPKMITLDTISRMVEGDENSATTYLQLYRNSMTPLKARGICVLRIDHAGKDTGRGQRGSSAKSGDVDVVWRLSRESEDFLVLEREKSRNGHGEPTVVLQKLEEPCLRFEWDACSLVDGQVMEIAKRLDRYGADLNCTRESAEALLHEYNVGARHSKVSAALKYRRDQSRNGGQGTGDKDQAKGWSPSKYSGVDEDGCPF